MTVKGYLLVFKLLENLQNRRWFEWSILTNFKICGLGTDLCTEKEHGYSNLIDTYECHKIIEDNFCSCNRHLLSVSCSQGIHRQISKSYPKNKFGRVTVTTKLVQVS